MKGTGGFLNPEKVIQEFDIKEGMKIADFGCGTGYFTILLAKMIGEKGRVYALDVLETALESVRSRAKSEGLLNIETIRANLEIFGGSKLENESVDLVLLANILFQSSKKADIIKEAERALKKGGRVIVIDWKKDQPMGPPQNLIVLQNSAKEFVEKVGLKFEREIPAGDNHWGMMFSK